jgi:hypothetical protein
VSKASIPVIAFDLNFIEFLHGQSFFQAAQTTTEFTQRMLSILLKIAPPHHSATGEATICSASRIQQKNKRFLEEPPHELFAEMETKGFH